MKFIKTQKQSNCQHNQENAIQILKRMNNYKLTKQILTRVKQTGRKTEGFETTWRQGRINR